ncbi:unnamed protein product [Rotaria sp. Silwood1]|nr:unnamed protein product [Rotaria sp. Silwood1]
MADKNASYSGFNEYNPLLDTTGLKHDTDLQQALIKTSHGRRAPTNTNLSVPSNSSVGRLGTASSRTVTAATQKKNNNVINAPLGSTLNRPTTAQKRPTTAIDGAGFIVGSGALGSYIPTTSGPSQYEKKEESNDEKVRRMEKVIFDLVEQSCFAYEKNDTKLALEKAEQAMKHEKSLSRYREEQNIAESDLSLSGFVCIKFDCLF